MVTVINQYKIVNNSNSKGLKFHFANSINDSITVGNISFNKSGSTADANYSANWGGFSRLITVEFVLFNDGSDKSTDASSKITLSDQWDHMMETVIQGKGASDDQSDVTYTLTIHRDGVSTKTFTGSIENIDINGAPSQSGNRLTGTLILLQGGIS